MQCCPIQFALLAAPPGRGDGQLKLAGIVGASGKWWPGHGMLQLLNPFEFLARIDALFFG
jgi:hypothetical protein